MTKSKTKSSITKESTATTEAKATETTTTEATTPASTAPEPNTVAGTNTNANTTETSGEANTTSTPEDTASNAFGAVDQAAEVAKVNNFQAISAKILEEGQFSNKPEHQHNVIDFKARLFESALRMFISDMRQRGTTANVDLLESKIMEISKQAPFMKGYEDAGTQLLVALVGILTEATLDPAEFEANQVKRQAAVDLRMSILGSKVSTISITE